MRGAVLKPIFMLVLGVSLFISALFVSWQLNRAANYFYPFFYTQLNISEHIKTYAPQNSLKSGFESIGATEHKRIFSETVHLIHGHGIGLADLNYYALDGGRIDKVFTPTEVAHLQEVAAVITLFTWAGYANLLISVVIILLSVKAKIRWPNFKRICQYFGGFILMIVLAFILFGFNQVFYYFHVLLFSDAPWIFSYRESLLIIFTKSPQLFALIGLCIGLLSIAIFLLLMYLLSNDQHKK